MRRALGPALATLGDGGNATLSAVLEAGGAPPIRARDTLRPGGPHTVPLRLWAVADRIVRVTPSGQMRRLVERGRAFAAELAATIGGGVLLHPPLPTVAPRHGRTYGRLLSFQPMGVFNLGAVPVTQVPLGLGGRGYHWRCKSSRPSVATTSRSPSQSSSSARAAAGFLPKAPPVRPKEPGRYNRNSSRGSWRLRPSETERYSWKAGHSCFAWKAGP